MGGLDGIKTTCLPVRVEDITLLDIFSTHIGGHADKDNSLICSGLSVVDKSKFGSWPECAHFVGTARVAWTACTDIENGDKDCLQKRIFNLINFLAAIEATFYTPLEKILWAPLSLIGEVSISPVSCVVQSLRVIGQRGIRSRMDTDIKRPANDVRNKTRFEMDKKKVNILIVDVKGISINFNKVLVVLSSTAEDGENKVRISVGGCGSQGNEVFEEHVNCYKEKQDKGMNLSEQESSLDFNIINESMYLISTRGLHLKKNWQETVSSKWGRYAITKVNDNKLCPKRVVLRADPKYRDGRHKRGHKGNGHGNHGQIFVAMQILLRSFLLAASETHLIDIAINQDIHRHKMEGGNISLKIEPDEELENNLLQQVKLEVKTENNLQVKSEVFLKEEVLSYQTPEFEFVSVSPNHSPIKVEFTRLLKIELDQLSGRRLVVKKVPSSADRGCHIYIQRRCLSQTSSERSFVELEDRSKCKAYAIPKQALKGRIVKLRASSICKEGVCPEKSLKGDNYMKLGAEFEAISTCTEDVRAEQALKEGTLNGTPTKNIVPRWNEQTFHTQHADEEQRIEVKQADVPHTAHRRRTSFRGGTSRRSTRSTLTNIFADWARLNEKRGQVEEGENYEAPWHSRCLVLAGMHHKMEGEKVSVKIEPEEDLENHLHQREALEDETEDYIPIKPEVILEEDLQSYKSPEFEFVSIPINLPSIKVEPDKHPNETEYIATRSFNNDCSKQKKKEEYFINNKGTQLRSTCKEGVCPNLALKGDTLNDIGPKEVLTEDEDIRQLLEESNKIHPTNCSQQETKQMSIAESEVLRYVAGYIAHRCKDIDKTLGSKVIPMTTPDNHSWIATLTKTSEEWMDTHTGSREEIQPPVEVVSDNTGWPLEEFLTLHCLRCRLSPSHYQMSPTFQCCSLASPDTIDEGLVLFGQIKEHSVKRDNIVSLMRIVGDSPVKFITNIITLTFLKDPSANSPQSPCGRSFHTSCIDLSPQLLCPKRSLKHFFENSGNGCLIKHTVAAVCYSHLVFDYVEQGTPFQQTKNQPQFFPNHKAGVFCGFQLKLHHLKPTVDFHSPKELQGNKRLPSQGLQESKSLPSQGLQESKSLPSQAFKRARAYGPKAFKRARAYRPKAFKRARFYRPRAFKRARAYCPKAFKRARAYLLKAFKRARFYRPRAFKRAIAYRPKPSREQEPTIPGLHESKILPSKDLQESKSLSSQGLQESKSLPSQGLQESNSLPTKGLQESKNLPSQGLQESKSLPSKDLQESKSLQSKGLED
uniref:Uncharacterized protein n=1 Tax=Timema monikensis TaxID=170555 RepID=A0A7R9E022_9NEOP|nr:unnamed protein product [Timema monikensis]